MKVEVLVATVNCTDIKKLIKKMNIQTDAIIANQCDHIGYEEIKYNNSSIKVYSFPERGVGLNRNNALMRASGDIVLFADDDEALVDKYEKKIINEFKTNKKADMLVFGVDSVGGTRNACHIKKSTRVHKYNSLKYGAVRFALKLDAIRKNNICFSLLFGGGARYGSGEDSIFIYDCLNNKMKVYTSPVIIGTVDFSDSSWFNGYNEKYYFDKGALFYSLHKKFALLFSLIYLLRHRNEQSSLTFNQKLSLLKKGINHINRSDKYEK